MDVKVSLNNAELAALEVALARANSVRLDGIHMKQLVQILQMDGGVQTIKKDETKEKHAVLLYEFTVCYGFKCKI